MRALVFVLVVLLAGGISVAAQETSALDSLTSRLPQTVGLERLETLENIAGLLARRHPDSALVYCTEGIDLAVALGNQEIEAGLRIRKSGIHRTQSAYQTALEELDTALRLVTQLGDTLQQARTLYRIGAVHTVAGSLDEALDYYLQSMPLAEEIEDEHLLAALLAQIGLVYQTEGIDSGETEKLEEALAFYRRSADLKEQLDLPSSLANTLSNMGTVLRAQGEFDQSLELQERALDIRIAEQDRIGEARSLNNIGMVHLDSGRLDDALSVFEQSNRIKQELGLRRDYVNGLLNVADVHIAAGRTVEAANQVTQAREYAGSTEDFVELRRLYRTESQVLEATDRFEEALESYKAFKAADDSIQNQANRNRLADLQTQYQTREKEQEIRLLQQDSEIEELYRRLLLGGLVALALLIFLLYNRFRFKARSNAALQQANTALSESMHRLTETQDRLIQTEKMASLGQLTAGIAHEIKNPLNFINNFADLNAGLVDELMEQMTSSPELRLSEIREDLDDLKANAFQISKHGSRADGIVRSMLEHSRIAPSDETTAEVNDLVDEYVTLAYHGAKASTPGFAVNLEKIYSPEAGSIVCQPQEIGRVLINLLDNAFYAVRESKQGDNETGIPDITVKTRREGPDVIIEISDSGPGIPDDVLKRIFEPFFTTKPTGTGTGLGLSLGYEIITRGHGGSLHAENLPGGGARFTICLPRVAG